MKLASPYVIVYQTSNSTLSKKNNPKQSGPYRTWIERGKKKKKKPNKKMAKIVSNLDIANTNYHVAKNKNKNEKEGNLVFSFK